jgi:drug/metabolite transporter (DMT)-like permease
MVRLTPRIALLLTLPPLLWASNAVVGRLAVGVVSPVLLNGLRWAIAAVILMPLGWRVLKAESLLWKRWRRFAALGLLGVGSYNALQYLALQTSTPVNVTLIASSMPVWMLAVGALRHGEHASRKQVLGAVLSLAGVAMVLSRGDWSTLLQVRLVPGDLFMLLAVLLWAFYSWMLARPSDDSAQRWPWAQFLMAQVVFGTFWALLAAGGEWAIGRTHIEWTGWVLALLLFVAIGPSLIAYRCWGLGVATVGPAVASFFNNLTPLFAALLSAAVLGEAPHWYHGVAFVLIAAGIVVSSRR